MRQEAIKNDASSDERRWRQKVMAAEPSVEKMPAKKVHEALLSGPPSPCAIEFSRDFLLSRLALSNATDSEVPDEPGQLWDQVDASARKVADSYQGYLRDRKAGAGRRYFHTRGQARSFIAKVAPTKIVDGAWLYGVLESWNDVRLRSLVDTFLEELGSGDPDHNHVLLYRKLMAAEGCEPLAALDDRYYEQGAIQLALGYHAQEFLPELIGYNLGYEQLPLHLLITAYELAELGIDPYYFTLHVTVDNASTGHARRAVQAVVDNLPANMDERADYMRRIRRGYGLNDLGVGSVEIIAGFDAEQEVIDILKRKSRYGLVHSDYCKIGGMTVNEWLADSEQIPRFLAALVEDGWIRRNQDPADSRFWHLLQGPRARMFGVFSDLERELIYEWIAGEWLDEDTARRKVARNGNLSSAGRERRAQTEKRAVCVPIRGHAALVPAKESLPRPRNAVLSTVPERDPSPEMMRQLIELMAPDKHHTPAGLRATQVFCDLCNNGL